MVVRRIEECFFLVFSKERKVGKGTEGVFYRDLEEEEGGGICIGSRNHSIHCCSKKRKDALALTSRFFHRGRA